VFDDVFLLFIRFTGLPKNSPGQGLERPYYGPRGSNSCLPGPGVLRAWGGGLYITLAWGAVWDKGGSLFPQGKTSELTRFQIFWMNKGKGSSFLGFGWRVAFFLGDWPRVRPAGEQIWKFLACKSDFHGMGAPLNCLLGIWEDLELVLLREGAFGVPETEVKGGGHLFISLLIIRFMAVRATGLRFRFGIGRDLLLLTTEVFTPVPRWLRPGTIVEGAISWWR